MQARQRDPLSINLTPGSHLGSAPGLTEVLLRFGDELGDSEVVLVSGLPIRNQPL